MSLFFTKKLPCWMLVFALVFQIFGANAAYGASLAETAEGENDPRILYDLVAIVVDSQLDADNNSYPGLEIDRDRKIGERVLRYAEDIRKNNDLTDVKILLFDRENDTVPELASSLENLYRNGDGTRENRLAGVVLVGDIPLPVVNKNGNRFISLFPYTDFSNKSYIFNGETETFDFNAAVAFPKPEIWHGVIRPLTNDDAGRQKLAEYFDKNHLYYEKDPDFAEFEKKLFFADLTHEEEQIFEDVYLHYEEYVESMEDLAYMRYNKFWAKDVMDDVIQDIPINEENEYNRETPDGAPGFGEQLRNTDLLDGLQDVRSKNIIDQFLIPYYRVLNRYISKVNDWAAYSGRWSNGGVSSVPALINIKDEFTKFYLRSVNDALEKKMNEVIAEIEEPLPVIDYSTISGKVGDDPFMVSLDNDGDTDMLEAAENLVFGEDFTDQFYYRYHYFNEPDNKMYVNGIEADVLDSAKQCSVYLGSTKPDYYNGELKFDPKNVNGEYSILTRSMRSDSLLSAAPMRTAGVNTRLLPPQELAEITDGNYEGGFNTDGVYETGAVIEDVPEYGVAAFLDNTLHTAAEKYEGPFEKKLRKGDVIVSVNGKKLSYAHTFDDAIKEAFDETGRFIDAMNDREPQQLADFTYDIAIKNETNILENTVDSVTDVFEPDAEYEILDTPEEIINSGRFMEIFAELDGAEKMFNEGDTVVGLMSVDFYRDGDRHTETFTFSVTIMEGGMGKITTRDEADGSELDIAVVFSDQGIPENFDPYAETEGAIFTLYDNNTLGYGYDEYDEIDNDDGGAYDASAGCNYQSTSKNSDRCIPMLATMPVLDPAGSQMPVKTEVPGAGVAIKFPENVKKNNENRNSDNPLHYRQHADMFQFPSTYQFDDVDKLYMDSCYRGLPAMTLGKYKFPLDPTIGEESGGSNEESFRDFYGRLINSFGDFISGEMEDSDGVDLNSRWLEFNIDPADEDNNNPSVYRARRDDFSPVDTLWLGLNEIDASEVVLSDGNTQVTLKNFADRYGLFDGIDNDNDGIRDYEWRDNKPGDEPDGVYDIKWYDFDEADGIYGIPSQNTGEIARKLLSHNSAYTIPYGLEGFPYHEFGENVTLTVNSHPYKNRRISSMIIHNEPTAYTIMQQEKSLAAQSMPIDNPRYVAFQSAPAAHIQNPNPPEPLDGLNIQSHYYPGQIHKINYVNLFKIPNMAQLQSELAQKAQEIAQIPGSYRIFGEDAGPDDYTVLEISRKIYEDYFAPAVNNLDDRPESGFDLEAAATRKIHDALKWKEMGIDDKHEYILEFYLNDDELHDAYAGDSPKGYEAAYFVLNGGEDSFEMNFNKSQPEETDLRFDPVAPYVSDTDVAAAAGPAPEETVEDEVGFVWLDEFLGELQGFFDDFENVGVKEVEFSDVKFDVPAVETEITGDAPIDIDIEAESRVLVANGRSRTKLEFILRDKNGNIANSSYAQVSVFADNILELDATGDLSGKIPGVQLASFDGKVDIEVTAKNTSGNGKIIAVLTDSELEDLLLETDDISKINFENYPGKSVTIEVVEDAYLELSVLDENFDATESVAADGQSLARIAVKLKSGDRVLNSYNGPVKFTLLTEILGRFTGELPEKMTNGILAPGNVNFQSGTRAGDVEILVEAPDFARNIVKFKSLPGDPVKLEMQSSSNILPSENEEIVLQARVTDRFGNLVNTMNGKTVRFSPTEASSALVEFDPAVAVASGGVATTVLRGKKVSGTINIIAESDDLIPAKVSFKASKKVDAEKIKDFEPRALYVSVLGGNFGDTDGTNVAETMLYNGKVQAVSAVTTSAKNLRLFGVDGYGRLEIFENGVKSVEVAATDSFPFPKTILSDSVNDTELAEIFIVPSNDGQKFDHDARLLVMDEYLENYLPGVYIMPKSSSGKYGFVEAFSGNSDIEPKGFYFVDFETEIDQAQLPGSPFTSLEDAGEKFGLGLEGDNKHMLFFAAGNSVGESNIPYASDAGIIFGDPMVRLNVDEQAGASGYGKDIGKQIYSGKEEIKQILDFDFNGDSYDDILLVYEDGFVKLLENKISNDRFVERGDVIFAANGIESATRIDVNNDGYDDLIVGAKESCNAGEECISLFINNEGNFVREPLNLSLGNRKALVMKSTDINRDGCDDLIVSDSSGYISVFYNKEDCGGLETNFGFRKGFGFEVTNEDGLADNLFVNYPGMNGSGGDGGGSGAENLLDFGFASFAHIGEIDRLSSSTKASVDVNGAPAEIGDQVDYVITLKNTGGSGISNLMISDLMSPAMSLAPDSLQCMDSGCSDELVWKDTGMSLRPKAIAGVSVPAYGTRRVKYSMLIEKMPKVDFEIGRDFVEYPEGSGDPYPDILVRPQANKNGILIHLYSVDMGGNGYVRYEELEAPTSAANTADTLEQEAAKLGYPRQEELQTYSQAIVDDQPALSPAPLITSLKKTAGKLSQDADYNGCPDSWSSVVNKTISEGANMAGAVADTVGAVLSGLRCSGGCLPIPNSIAFLAPDGPIPGVALFASGLPTPPFIGFGVPSYIFSTFRVYLSPTSTLGLGTAVCAGPSVGHFSPCFAFSVPGPSAACGALIESAIDSAVVFAKDTVIDPVIGQAAIISDGTGSESSSDLTVTDALSDPEDIISAAADVNVRIPGFPGLVTNWLDRQMDEIYGKLLSFPTFYLILPDISTLALDAEDQKVIEDSAAIFSKEINWQNFNDFATSLSRLPILRIDTKEILIKVPAISKKEIEKYKDQAQRWMDYMEKEVERFTSINCGIDVIDDTRASLCDKILLDIDQLVRSVRKLLSLLDRIADLPRDILDWRHLEAKYASQIVAYLDAIMFYTGGYIKKQQKIIEAWMDTVQDVIQAFESWKIILQLAIDYQAGCDQCKNDRFGKLGFLLSLFMVLPDLPIIPLPKLPDIVVDLSNIRTGVRILWPDVVFKPQPIILPDLPTITLPDLIPGLKIEIPGFEVPEFPELIMPVLPDLPPLSIPQLPDLPRPPKIPPISDLVADVAANLRPIFTILCLLKNGLIPVPEAGLAAEIETLTQPGIQAIIPILKHLAVQLPPIQYDYVKEMRLNAQLRFDIDTTGIVEAVQAGAKIWNKEVGDIVKAINRLLAIPYGEMLSQAIELAIKKAEEEGLKYIEEEAGDAVENLKPVLLDDGGRNSSFTPEYSTDDYGVKQQYDALNRTLSEFINNLETDAGYPDKFYLTATETLLDRDDPILNKPLGENIALGDLPNDPYIRRLADLRNSLFSYAKNLNENNDLLAQIDDYNDFTKALADGDESLKIAAALTGTDVAGVQRENDFPAGQKNLNMSFLGENVERKLLAQADNTFGDQRLLAAEIADDYTATFVPKGFFIVADGVNENVLGYTLELGKNMQSIFNDVDRDEDADIIFSMGGDVYLKENRTNKPDLPAGNFIISFDKNTVSDYAKNAPVENLSVPYTGSGKVDLNWQPKPGAVSYEVKIRKSLNDDISDAVVDMDTTATKISLQLQNGNYYAKIFAVDNDGNRSMASDDIILSPQSCADKEPPFAAVEDSYDVSILKDLEIDTKNSFDADGEIVEYYMEEMSSGRILWSDKDLSNDSDGDGNAANDRNNTVFRIGPFTKKEDIGIHKYILHLIDQSGNSSSTEMAVNVFAPQISLNDTFARTGIATGATEAAVSELPFSMMRERLIYRLPEESLKVVPRLEKAAEGITDADGSYTLDNFNSENLIFVENAAGKVVAKIQPSTGNIGELADGYSTRVNEAYPPFKATNVEIMSAGGDVMATVYLVSNGNVDVHINSPASGVNVTDFQGDEYKFVSLPANDRSYPGGAMLVGGGKNPLLAVDTSGNILILDEGVTLRRKNNDLRNDPLTIEVRIGGDTAGEIFVNPFRDGASVVGPKDIPAATPVGPSEAAIYGSYPFDFNSETATFVNRDQTVSREEFVRMVLNMLCIIPRKEAYQNFAAGSGYSDIEFKTGDENFAYIKEATMLGLVEGYKGEAYENGLLPFKPENPVSRAEAVKIILEAMELQNLISLENVSEGSPWYEPFMRLAGDVNGKFIITDEEARDAEKELKYGALVTMAERVLTISDCVKIDKDRDGMSDYCEAKYEIDDPLKDEDGDGLQNKDECFYGLNPKDSDTDNGGTSDGQEINFGTNPRHRADDPEDNDEDGLSDSAEILIYGTNPNDEDSDDGGTDDGQEAVNLTDPLDGLDDGKRGKRNSGEDGIYIVPAKCDTCPCVSTLIDSAEVVEGDKFFPVIGTFGEDGKDDGKVDIFSKGNEVIIEEIQ